VVQARAEGSGEAQLRARLIVRKVRGSLVVEPYSDLVTQKEEGVKEYLELLNRLMGGSFSVEAAEMKGKRAKGLWPSKDSLRSKRHSFRRRWLGRDARVGEGHKIPNIR